MQQNRCRFRRSQTQSDAALLMSHPRVFDRRRSDSLLKVVSVLTFSPVGELKDDDIAERGGAEG